MSHFVSGNQIVLLQNGEAYFPAIERAFENAKKEIYLETYIFEYDETGKRIAEALKRAARRGIEVHVLVDGFGSKNLTQSAIEDMRAAGVKLLKFRPKISHGRSSVKGCGVCIGKLWWSIMRLLM